MRDQKREAAAAVLERVVAPRSLHPSRPAAIDASCLVMPVQRAVQVVELTILLGLHKFLINLCACFRRNGFSIRGNPLTTLGNGGGSGNLSRCHALCKGGARGGQAGADKGKGDHHGLHGAFLKVRLMSDRTSMRGMIVVR